MRVCVCTCTFGSLCHCLPPRQGLEANVSDANAVLLLFIELTDEIVSSECAVDRSDAVTMAAMQLFLNFGEGATKQDVR